MCYPKNSKQRSNLGPCEKYFKSIFTQVSHIEYEKTLGCGYRDINNQKAVMEIFGLQKGGARKG